MPNIAAMKLHMLSHQDPMSCGGKVQIEGGGDGRRNWGFHMLWRHAHTKTNGDEKSTKIIRSLLLTATIGRKRARLARLDVCGEKEDPRLDRTEVLGVIVGTKSRPMLHPFNPKYKYTQPWRNLL